MWHCRIRHFLGKVQGTAGYEQEVLGQEERQAEGKLNFVYVSHVPIMFFAGHSEA